MPRITLNGEWLDYVRIIACIGIAYVDGGIEKHHFGYGRVADS